MEKVSEAEPRQAFSPTTWFPSSPRPQVLLDPDHTKTWSWPFGIFTKLLYFLVEMSQKGHGLLGYSPSCYIFLFKCPKKVMAFWDIHQVAIFSCAVWLFLKRVALWLSRQTKRTASHGWFCVFLRHTMSGERQRKHILTEPHVAWSRWAFGPPLAGPFSSCKGVQGNLEQKKKNENESEPCTAALKQHSQRHRF